MSQRRLSSIWMPGLLGAALFAPGVEYVSAQVAPAVKSVVAAPAVAAKRSPSRIETFKNAEGESFYALSLMPQTTAPIADARDVVVLFDTSASQSGAFRDKALAALNEFTKTLGDRDRVSLFSVDVRAVPMTSTLVGTHDPEFAVAMDKLAKRAPLGSTDMGEALATAAEQLSASKNPKRVVYIGDGQNNAGLAGTELRKLLDRLVAEHVSVSSYSIGPDTNIEFLAALSNLTGGSMIVDSENFTGQQAGSMLDGIAKESVIWPSGIKLPTELQASFPSRVPPFRADRDTVIIGKGTLDKAADVVVEAEALGKPIELKWTVQPAAADSENAYLAQLVKIAETDGGYGLPTLGTEGLHEARFVLTRNADGLAKLSRQAFASGRPAQAKQLVDESLRRDPNNMQAAAMRNAMERSGVTPTALQTPAAPGGGNDLQMVRRQSNEPAAPEFAPGLLGTVEERIALIEQKLRGEVLQGLNGARGMLGVDPTRVEVDLKQLLERVDSTPDLRAAPRAELREMLTKAIREAQAASVGWEADRLAKLQINEAGEERKQTLEAIFSRQAQVKQLIERYNALLKEGRYKDAELRAAVQAYAIEQSPATLVARENAFLLGTLTENIAIHTEKRRNAVSLFLEIERASIPFPGEPPIVYPDADVWRDLTRRRAKYKAVDLRAAGSSEEKINRALEENTTFDFTEGKLTDVVDFIQERHKIPVQIDTKALEEAAFDSATPINKRITDVKLRSALRLLLNDYALSYVIENDVLLITSKTSQENKSVVKVYPVADLVIPITNGGGINPFSLGGGVGGGGAGAFGAGGGQQGGFGGGNGVGIGGGGGGFGGGGGGGFFSVPDPIVLPTAADEPQAFAIPDENLTLKKAPSTLSATQPRGIPEAPKNVGRLDMVEEISKELDRKPQMIVVAVAPNEDPETPWSKYFAALPDIQGEKNAQRLVAAFHQDADVRETARRLMNDQKYKETIGMIRAALRNGYAQPWMYEALGLAMLADDQPKEEIERALMSAVDYAATTEDLMFAALYMGKLDGLKPRALKLMHRVAELEPTRQEPYRLGMHLAEQLGDLDAIEWSALGILAQGSTREQADIENHAQRLALSTLETLQKQGKTAEVARFKKALHDALSRDLIVRVTWTGDADIDLLVEEPTGTVCSASNPRTISGGVLIGGSTANKSAKSGGTITEEYVVPRGFAGTYRIMLKRVWGQVTAGKVRVEVLANHGSEKSVVKSEFIPLGEKPALVLFDLKEARRIEKLPDIQVAVAARDQLRVGQAVLAQQLAALPTGYGGSSGAPTNALVPNGLFPFNGRSAVGYQPVITTLPEGTNMSAQAVVSADRRYVRITSTPLFSTIPEVSTFNFATGSGSTQGGGTGGGGIGGGGIGGGGIGGGGGNPGGNGGGFF